MIKKKFSSKRFGVGKILVLRIILCPNYFVSKKLWALAIISYEKIFVAKIFVCKIVFDPLLGPKKLRFKRFLGPKKIIWIQNDI